MAEILTAVDITGRSFEDSVVTVGVFDGVHVGHQKVLHALAMKKRGLGAKRSVLMTFDRHPLGVTHPEMVPPLLTTLEEKLSLLERFNVDVIFVERFTEELARMEYRDFIDLRLVKRLGMIHLVIGYDFHLGRDRRGSQDALVRMGVEEGFGVTVVPPVVVGGSVISSTKIRRAVSERKLGGAARCLTRAYFFDADVVRGEGVGRELDFPTANVAIPSRGKLIPPDGVYAVEVEMGGTVHGGMMNIGSAPTIHAGPRRSIEVHLFDFSGDLYGRRLRVRCLEYLRREKTFRGPEELRAQLARDREKALAILEKND